VDVGADKCVACKAMKPILAELRQEYDGRVRVDFVDAWVDRDGAATFNVRTIPTQIFFDARGGELWRHEGFISKDDILARWRQLGMLPERQGG
jgi:thioredoxin 1